MGPRTQRRADATALNVASLSTSRANRDVYEDQIEQRQASNDPAWRAAVTTIKSLDRARQLRRAQARIENGMFWLAVFSILCVAGESELFWVEWDEIQANTAADAQFEYSGWFITLKMALTVSSALLLIGLVLRYQTVCRIRVETKQLPPHATFYHMSSGLLISFLCEAVVCTVHVPLLSTSHQILRLHESYLEHLDQMDVVVFARIYLLGRLLRNKLGYNSSSHDIQLIGTLHQVNLTSVWFSVKFSFQKFPFLCTAAILMIDWVLTASALNFFERGSNDRLTSVNEATWMTIVTITGVGYGEISPTTLNGKLTVVFGAIIGGMIITCLLRVVLIDALLISPQEKIVLDVVQFYEYARRRKACAAFLIQSAWKWHMLKSSERLKSRFYAAAEASRLLRFMQFPELAGAHSAAASTTFGGAPGGTVGKQLEQLLGRMKLQRSTASFELQRTVQALQGCC